jgi:hypothetical protein
MPHKRIEDDGPELAGDIRQGRRGEQHLVSGAPPQNVDLAAALPALLERSTRNTGDRSLPRRADHQHPCHRDDSFRPLAFCLSPDNVADIPVVPALLAGTPPSRQFLADQAYDACAFRQRLAEKGSARRVTSKSGAVCRSGG